MLYKIDRLLTQHRHVPVARLLGPLKVRLEKLLGSADHSAEEVRSRVRVLAMVELDDVLGSSTRFSRGAR